LQQPVRRDDKASAEQQHRQDRLLADATYVKPPRARLDLEGPENPELHRFTVRYLWEERQRVLRPQSSS
jgi:hypothetical protein